MFNGYEWMTRVLEVRPDRMGALPASDDSVPQPPGVVGGYPVNLGVGVGVGMGGVGVGVGGGVGVVGPGVVGLSQTLQIPRYPGRDSSGGGSPSPFPGGFGVGLNIGMEEDPSLAGRSLFVGNVSIFLFIHCCSFVVDCGGCCLLVRRSCRFICSGKTLRICLG